MVVDFFVGFILRLGIVWIEVSLVFLGKCFFGDKGRRGREDLS